MAFNKALLAFKDIQKKDSLNPTIRQYSLNGTGYDYMNNRELENAIEIFKINVVLYPKSSNVYNSLGEAYLRKKDTLKAVENLNKSLSINPENRSSKRLLKKITEK